jgi:DNA-binding winged helix-turn-helix (wHTH) protein
MTTTPLPPSSTQRETTLSEGPTIAGPGDRQAPACTVLRFGTCEIDSHRHELRVAGRVVALQPRVFALLDFLARNPGRAIPKAELLQAVWGTLHVTDAVLATAVRKLRQAVGDTRDDMPIVTTLRGVGYRFDAQTLLGSSAEASGTIAVLRIANATGDPAFDWVEHGLAILLHEKLERSGRLRPAALMSSLGWYPQPGRTVELERACRALGTESAVAGRLERAPQGLRLCAHWGNSDASSTAWQADDNSEAALVEQLAAALLDRPVAMPAPQQAFWEGQLARSFDLERRGMAEQALSLLQTSLQHLPPSLRTTLLHARLLRQRMALQQAEQVLQAARTAEVTPDQAALRPLLLTEQAELELLRSNPAAARRASDEALALIIDGRTAADTLSTVLATASRIDYVRGEYHSSALKALRAKAAAEAMPDPAARVAATIAYSRAVYMEGSVQLAMDALRDAAAIAHASELASLEADVYLQLGFEQSSRWQHAQAAECARRAAALASAHGDRATWHRAQVREMIALAESGRVVEASSLVDRHFGTGADWHTSITRSNEQMIRWTLDWRCGRADAAIQRLEEGLAAAAPAAADRRRRISYRLMICLLACGRVDRAQAVFDAHGEVGYLTRTAHLEAAFAIAHGKRAQAASGLRRVWLTGDPQDAETWHAIESLAWLLLEDQDVDSTPALARELARLSREQASVPLVLHLHDLRHGSRAWDAAHWKALVSTNHGLVHRHSWLLDEAACRSWLNGRGPKLGALLTDACY